MFVANRDIHTIHTYTPFIHTYLDNVVPSQNGRDIVDQQVLANRLDWFSPYLVELTLTYVLFNNTTKELLLYVLPFGVVVLFDAVSCHGVKRIPSHRHH